MFRSIEGQAIARISILFRARYLLPERAEPDNLTVTVEVTARMDNPANLDFNPVAATVPGVEVEYNDVWKFAEFTATAGSFAAARDKLDAVIVKALAVYARLADQIRTLELTAPALLGNVVMQYDASIGAYREVEREKTA